VTKKLQCDENANDLPEFLAGDANSIHFTTLLLLLVCSSSRLCMKDVALSISGVLR